MIDPNNKNNFDNIRFLRRIARIRSFFDIRKHADREGTISAIKRDVYLKGSNFWYLICSTLLASIGLDLNSEAVIIGAMLISPLMTPILGIGLSFGIHDRETLWLSIRQFSAAVIISLAVSALYFVLTPLGQPTEMIIARTKPTILDVLIALFGGFAGIVAVSRSYAVSAIPGVAIATALMPPVCVSGFGIATGRINVFLGAFYLFFINSVFISFSAFLLVRLLRFPIKEYEDYRKKVKMRMFMLFVIIVVTVPSMFIFYNIIDEVRRNIKINEFVNKKIKADDRNVMEWKFYESKKDSNLLSVYLIGEKFSDAAADSLNNMLPDYGIENTGLKLYQLDANSDVEYMRNEIKADVLKAFEVKRQLQMKEEEEKLKSKQLEDSLKYANAVEEIKALYPELGRISYTKSMLSSVFEEDSLIQKSTATFVLEWPRRMKLYLKKNNEKRIYEFLKLKLELDTVQILNY
jgi:uncharacterized hydrophobic protein (TIGR00271 family)